MVVSCGAELLSRSQMSWWTVWKCQRRLPVLASSAMRQSPKRLAPLPVPAIEVVLRAAGRDVDDAALLVDRLLAPVVGAADGLPRVRRPGVVAELAGPRHGVKRPDQRAGAHVERADVAGRRRVLLVGRRAQDDEVLEHPPRRAALLVDRRRIAVEARRADPPGRSCRTTGSALPVCASISWRMLFVLKISRRSVPSLLSQ